MVSIDFQKYCEQTSCEEFWFMKVLNPNPIHIPHSAGCLEHNQTQTIQ